MKRSSSAPMTFWTMLMDWPMKLVLGMKLRKMPMSMISEE